MKKNNFYFITLLFAVVCVGTSFSMEPSDSWYDWASSGAAAVKSWYDGSSPDIKISSKNKDLQQNVSSQDLHNQHVFEMAMEGDVDGVLKLIDGGFDINTKISFGDTLLHVACHAGDIKLVHSLVEHGADRHIKDREGLIPYEVALDNGYTEIADYLQSFDKPLKVEKKEVKQVDQSHSKGVIKNKHRQEQNVHNRDLPEVNRKEGTCESGKYTFEKNSSGKILLTGSNRIMYAIYKTSLKNECISPGVYYYSFEGSPLIPVPFENSKKMVKNHLEDLIYSDHVVKKKNDIADDGHNFPECLEKNFGDWARVVIKKPIDPNQLNDVNKRFTLMITIPGRCNRKEGVFEFIVKKRLYEYTGECRHRFFKMNGDCGARSFGGKTKKNIHNG